LYQPRFQEHLHLRLFVYPSYNFSISPTCDFAFGGGTCFHVKYTPHQALKGLRQQNVNDCNLCWGIDQEPRSQFP